MSNKVGARFSPTVHEVVSFYKSKGDAKALEIAGVFGWIWSYCQLREGVCRASIVRMADEVNLSRPTFLKHLGKLVDDGFLIDTTPDLTNAPHAYRDAEIYKGVIVVDAYEKVEEKKPEFFKRKSVAVMATEADLMDD